ncbi:MAG: hypothetical protein IJH12_05610 [Clostridia bacterium]|nr:hypothetical protein [Clostridia bacterium]
METIKNTMERVESLANTPIRLDDGGLVVKLHYATKYTAFTITGDGSNMEAEMNRANWSNGLRYYMTLSSEYVGKFCMHGGKLAIYTTSGCVIMTKFPNDYRDQLYALGYHESFDCWVPGSGAAECIPLPDYTYLH